MWLELLKRAVDETSQQAVAERLGISRGAVSLLVSGKYPARTDRMARLILGAYATVHCPFLEEEISAAACRDYHTREAPTSSPFAMRHWRACQGCPNKGAF